MSDWRLSFVDRVEHRDIEGAVRLLQSQATAHAGTAPAKVKNAAMRSLQKSNRNPLYFAARQFCYHSDPTAQEVGSLIVIQFYGEDAEDVYGCLRHVANSDHWEVREWAASACGKLLERHFAKYYPVLCEWAEDESERIRRAVVLACMYAGKSRNPEYCERDSRPAREASFRPLPVRTG